LFGATSLQPQLTGFEGHAPGCQLTGGALPPGLVLNSNCTVTGRPVAVGRYTADIKVTAAGASGSVQISATLEVGGPLILWTPARDAFLTPLPVGGQVNDAPLLANWTPPADLPLTWRYTLVSGSLPPGLGIDPATGVVSGIATTAGHTSAVFQVSLSTPAGTFDLSATYGANVQESRFAYLNESGTGQSQTGFMRAFVGQPFLATVSAPSVTLTGVTLASNASNPFGQGAVQTLPAGLTLNPATGEIAGTPTAAAGERFLDFRATQIGNGVSSIATASLQLDVEFPMFLRYASPTVAVGTPLTLVPEIVPVSPLPLVAAGASSYTLAPGFCSLPPGVSLDGATGVLSGTPSTAGSFLCNLRMVMTNNGVQWNSSAQAIVEVR
jgi:hypothetical protein